jgi:hypothetical protein
MTEADMRSIRFASARCRQKSVMNSRRLAVEKPMIDIGACCARIRLLVDGS